MKNVKTVTNKVPPDGGYGWVIAFSMAMNGFLYIPLMLSFGLIFKDTFAQLGLSAAQGSLVINLHASFGMLTGLLNGVLVKMFGYRKIAFLAAILYFSGVTLTSFANSFQFFIITYGLIASLGLGLCRSSYGLAINTYFKERRSKAMGFAVTIIGAGSIVIPQLINLLMKLYSPQQVVLIFGGICANFFVTAMLLQPVKWHMKESPEPLTNEQKRNSQKEDNHCRDLEICDSHLSLNDIEEEEEEPKKGFFKSVAIYFDLDLLKDPIFVNILLGLSLAVFAELNFNVLTPFILNEYGLNNDQIATFMSIGGLADILFRLLAPYIGSYLKKPPRFMFLLTLVLLIIMRFILLFSTEYSMLLLCSTGLGIAKGVRRVYVGLIIPTHVSLKRLPSATGMEMMSNGFCILVGGAILGVIRDVTGNYHACILVMNFVTFITIVLWTTEGIVKHFKTKKENKASETEENNPLNKI